MNAPAAVAEETDLETPVLSTQKAEVEDAGSIAATAHAVALGEPVVTQDVLDPPTTLTTPATRLPSPLLAVLKSEPTVPLQAAAATDVPYELLFVL